MHFGGGGGGGGFGGSGGGHSGGGHAGHSSGGHDSSVVHHHDGAHAHEHGAANKDSKHHAAANGGTNGSSSGGSGLLAQIGHLLGLGGHGTVHHQHHSGGEPDQSPSWNMAWQAVPDPWFKFNKIRFRFTPALGMLFLFSGLILWLGVIYNVRHHEPFDNVAQSPSQPGMQQSHPASNPIIPVSFSAPTPLAAKVAAPLTASFQPQPASAAFGSPEPVSPYQAQPISPPASQQQQMFAQPGAGYAAQPMVSATPQAAPGAMNPLLRARPMANAYPAQRLKMFVQR